MLLFQNCSGGSATQSPQYNSSNAGGNSYDGKLEILAPTRMTPGQSVEIQVVGGEAPYQMSSSSLNGSFTDLGNGKFLFTLDASESAPSVSIDATDSVGDTGSVSIQIWGVNNWFFHFPRGMILSDEGDLLIVESQRPSITKMTLAGKIERLWDFENTPGLDLVNPEKLALLPQNRLVISDDFSTLFFLDIGSNRFLQKMDPGPNSLWNSYGGIEDIKVTPDGNLAVLCHSRIFFLDANGNQLSEMDITAGSNLNAGAMAYSPSGQLTVAKMGGLVQVFSSIGAVVNSFTIQNHHLSNVLNTMPREMTYHNSNEILYTNEEDWGDIVRYNISEQTSRDPFTRGHPFVRLSDMYGLVSLGSQGFITNEQRGFNIVVANDQGEMTDVFGRRGNDNFQYELVRDVHISHGITSVRDTGNTRIVQYDSQGQFLREIVDSELGGNGKIAIDSDGLIYMADIDEDALWVFNENGLIRKLNSGSGNGPTELRHPTSVTLHDDLLYITDGANARVLVWTKQGEFVRSFSVSSYPESLVIVENKIYVLKRYGAVDVDAFDMSGNPIPSERFENPQDLGLGKMAEPRDLIYSSTNQQFYVVSRDNHNITVFDRDGKFHKQVGGLGWDLGEFYAPEGLAVDSDGNIFVADTRNARIQILPAYLFK